MRIARLYGEQFLEYLRELRHPHLHSRIQYRDNLRNTEILNLITVRSLVLITAASGIKTLKS